MKFHLLRYIGIREVYYEWWCDTWVRVYDYDC